MRNKYIYAVLILTGLALLSCGGGASSPKDLGFQVFMALKHNNVNAYLKLCGGVDDQIYLFNRADLTREEKKEHIDDMLENRSEYEQDLDKDRRENFREVQSEYQWKNLQLDRVELGDIDEHQGINFYRHIYVHFKNGRGSGN